VANEDVERETVWLGELDDRSPEEEEASVSISRPPCRQKVIVESKGEEWLSQ
jgi:hypothetical protein